MKNSKSFDDALKHYEQEKQKIEIKLKATDNIKQRIELYRQKRKCEKEIRGLKAFMEKIGIDTRIERRAVI